MPLYMDCHHAEGIKIEEAEKAHLKDLAVQAKYNVKYLAYWVNEESGRVFCLMEAPDKESIQKTHLLANGVTACNIVEVEGGLYSAFMGKSFKREDDLVMTEKGEADGGFRFVLNLDLIATTALNDTVEFKELKLPRKPQEIAEKIILRNQGQVVSQLSLDRTIAFFETPESCLQGAIQIQEDLIKHKQVCPEGVNFNFKIGLSVGEPVNLSDSSMFKTAIDQSMWYCKIAKNGHIVLSEDFVDLSVFCKREMNRPKLTLIHKNEQEFIKQLFDYVYLNMDDFNFSVNQLSQEIGISRAQLYRKINSLANTSPVQFLRDIKLRHSLTLLKENRYTVAEIAYQLGYNNPSYFTKRFKDKYGVSPSKILVA